MAIVQDGTQKFGVSDSPITIEAITYIAESMSFNFTATRADLNDSNGEPVGSTIIPGRLEGSATIQLATEGTADDLRQKTFEISGTGSGDLDGTYYIVDVSEAQSQGDYAKVSINFYQQIN